MSELSATMQSFARTARRYLQVSQLISSKSLLLIAPLTGALTLASGGLPAAGVALELVIAALCLWGAAWTFNDLINARRLHHANSLILRGVLPRKEAQLLLIALTSVALLVAIPLGARFCSLLAVIPLVAFTYPWLRLRTYLIDAWFGLGIAWSVPLAYAASGRWPDKVGALLGVVTLLWAMGWLVLYQWPRHLELLQRGTRSLGLMFGMSTGYLVIVLQASVLFGTWMAGSQAKFGAPFYWLLLTGAAAITWESLLIHKLGSRATARALPFHLLSGVALWLGVVLHVATA